MNAQFAMTLCSAGEETITRFRPVSIGRDMDQTVAMRRLLPPNPYAQRSLREATVVITAPSRDAIAREQMLRSAVTVRSVRREAELRWLIHRVMFSIGFVTTGMVVGAIIGLLALQL